MPPTKNLKGQTLINYTFLERAWKIWKNATGKKFLPPGGTKNFKVWLVILYTKLKVIKNANQGE